MDIRHGRKHDMGDADDHEGDIYDAAVGAAISLTAANVIVDTATMTAAIAAAVAGLHWQENIDSFVDFTASEPGAPSVGDRYINTTTGVSSGTAQSVTATYIYEWNGSTWTENIPEDGWSVIEDGVAPNIAWIYTGSAWADFSSMLNHAALLNLDWPSSGHTGLLASHVEVSEIGTATYDDVQDLINNTNSCGYVDGGVMSDGGSGTLDITAIKGYIRATNSGIAELLSFDVTAVTGLVLTDLKTNFIYVDYNLGTPQIAASTTNLANGRTIFNLGKVFREGTGLHILQAGQNTTEQIKRIQSRENASFGDIVRTEGMLISDEGSENIKATAGVFFGGYTRHTTAEVDTSGAGDFEEYSRYSTAEGWNETTGNTQIDIANWNDITQTTGNEIVALTGNYYSNRWIYMDVDGHMLVVLGQGEYLKQAVCEAEGLPITDWGHIADLAILIGRVTIKQGISAFVTVESAFNGAFNPQSVNSHNNLSGIDGGTAGLYEHSDQGINIANTPEFAAMKLTGSASPAYAARTIHFDSDKNVFTVFNDNSNIALQLGEEMWIQGKCKPVGGLLEGQMVFLDGPSAAPPFPYLALAQATSGSAGKTIAMVTQPSAAQNATCFATSFGLVRDLDTSSGGALDTGSQNWVVGTELFLDPTTPGKLTSTKPTTEPDRIVRVGWVLVQHASNGVIFVNINAIPSAAAIIIADAGALFTAINVEAALAEVKALVDSALQDLVDDTTPQLGGDLDLNQKSIVFDPTPTSDVTWNGDEATYTAGAATAWGDICMLQADGKYDPADADAEATANGKLVFATGVLADAGTGVFVKRAYIRDDSWAWTIGARIWLSTTTGEITQTAPSGSGDVKRCLGYAESATVIWFDPSSSYVVI